MEKHWRDFCTLSLVHFMAFPELQSGEGPFVQSMRQVAEMDFFGALEMGPVNDPATRKEIAKTARELDFKLGYGAQPFILSQGLDLNSLDSEKRADALRKLKTAVDQACEMEAEYFTVLSGKYPGAENAREAYRNLAGSLENLADYSERRGIYILLEIFDRTVEKKALVGPAEEAAQLADMVRMEYPGFGLVYDMGHMPLLGESPEEVLPLLAPHLEEVHLGSCVLTPGHPSYGDKHPRFGYPEGVNGTGELVRFLNALFQSGYLGQEKDPEYPDYLPWVGFEVKPQPGETTEEILANIQQTWEEAWQQVSPA